MIIFRRLRSLFLLVLAFFISMTASSKVDGECDADGSCDDVDSNDAVNANTIAYTARDPPDVADLPASEDDDALDEDALDDEIITELEQEIIRKISSGEINLGEFTIEKKIIEEKPYSKYCVDEAKYCKGWASEGECEKNPTYMLDNCQCSCSEWFEWPMNLDELLEAVKKYGHPQEVKGQESLQTIEVIVKTVAYMEKQSTEVAAACRNQEDRCAFWVSAGEDCKADNGYMKRMCAPSCQACDLIDIRARCPPLGDDVTPGLLPGELNAMFERIVRTAPGNQSESVSIEEGMINYTVRVHSRPEPLDEDATEEESISFWRDLMQPPWAITLDNFLSEEECKYLIQLGHTISYEPSVEEGEEQVAGVFDRARSQRRKSEDARCTYNNECHEDPVMKRIRDRLAKVTGIPPENSEFVQIVKYEPGQFYRSHHDYVVDQRDRRAGPRVLTFFVYLSDVQEGGANAFPKLDITVKPKAGRAMLWPSVLNSIPMEKEPRTVNEVQDVIEGTMFGFNARLHLHNYEDAYKKGCN